MTRPVRISVCLAFAVVLLSANLVSAAPTAAPPAGKARPVSAPRRARAVLPGSAASPARKLEQANNLYSYGRYEAVVRLLRPLVERGLVKSKADRVEALRLYGICLFLTQRKSAALRVFRSLILLAPRTRLDSRLVQPEVITAFGRIRRPHLEKLRRETLKVRSRALRSLAKRYAVLNVLPPVGQFQNGHWRKGVIVLTLEVAMLAANLASYFLLRSKGLRQPDGTFVEKDADGNVVNDRRPLAKALMGINYASLGLLIGTLIYGMADGFVYHYREVKRLKGIINRPVVILPLPTRHGAGIALTFTF
jgi:hypothetical protein